MAVKTSARARKKSKNVLSRILTIVIVSVMIGGILLASLLSRLY